MKDWTTPDEKGTIHVPDELDPLVNKVAFQIQFVRLSGKNYVQATCDIVRIAQEFFKKNKHLLED